MLLIECPWCGKRDLTEFHAGGEAHIARPLEPDTITDEAWGNYIYFRKNTQGIHHERWMHALGCRRWFNAIRETKSDQFLAVYKTGEQPPEIIVNKEGET